jgi:hypothetical protein
MRPSRQQTSKPVTLFTLAMSHFRLKTACSRVSVNRRLSANKSRFFESSGRGISMATNHFFYARWDDKNDQRQPLPVLGSPVPWGDIEAAVARLLALCDRAATRVEGTDCFVTPQALAPANIVARSCPRLPFRLVVALLHLKPAYDRNEEAVVERVGEKVVRQLFAACQANNKKPLCIASLLGRLHWALQRQSTIVGRLLRRLGSRTRAVPAKATSAHGTWLQRRR